MPYYYKKTIRRSVPASPGYSTNDNKYGGFNKYNYSGGGGGAKTNGVSVGQKQSAPQLKRFQCPIKNRGAEIDVTNKSFEEIHEECLRKGIKFEDPEFPADDQALFYSQRPRMNFQWKRPHEISDNPQLFVGGASRFDIMQGELGDCWLLAAIASLSLNKDLLYRIIPPEQSFAKGKYCGCFHFQFWQYGEWMDVIIDDLLPTYNGRLIYLHSADKNEFWSALLEKAYAKLNGSYEALKGGSTTEAMEDFTGGVTETFLLNEAPKNLFNVMVKSLKKGALMGCAVETKSASQREAKLPNGLLMGHAYSVTGVDTLKTGVKLVRVRNPWGQVEWNGPWSDSSTMWNSVPDEKQRLAVEFDEDGEFWMSYRDFCKSFTKLEICNLGPDALEDDDVSSQWITSLHEGRWVRGCTAGGCRNFPDTFWINPQFRLKLEEEDDDPDDNEVGCSFIVSLMQKNRRKQKAKGQGLLTIGFALYKLKQDAESSSTLKKDFFLYNQSTARSKNYINLRENSQRFKLESGEYVIVPSTFQPNEEADFVLRIYTEKRAMTDEMDEETKRNDKVIPDPVPDRTKDRPSVKDTKQKDESTENDKRFKKLFEQLTGEDGEIDSFELQDIINSVMEKNAKSKKFKGFGLEACRSMVALMDVTRSGKLDYDEFKGLWVRVRKWINVFKQFDKDNSGTFDCYELREALSDAGYCLSSRLYQMLCLRYAGKDLTINLDDFILLSVRVEGMFNSFQKYRRSNKEASISLENWLITTMYS
uniref:Calpain-1 catalytic subunit-like n=1 Tax=Phallusia mammillata TaxID=59560 RepID=A0A6F9D928_9ASCI|nr:calpain-1 catalytic subunit-like [Phallusia mammillata]